MLPGATVQVLLENESTSVVLEDCGPDDWFKLNPGFEGFYRVQYDPADLALLRPAIENLSLGEVDRLNLLDDTFALVMAGKLQTTYYLDLVQVTQTCCGIWLGLLGCNDCLTTGIS